MSRKFVVSEDPLFGNVVLIYPKNIPAHLSRIYGHQMGDIAVREHVAEKYTDFLVYIYYSKHVLFRA